MIRAFDQEILHKNINMLDEQGFEYKHLRIIRRYDPELLQENGLRGKIL